MVELLLVCLVLYLLGTSNNQEHRQVAGTIVIVGGIAIVSLILLVALSLGMECYPVATLSLLGVAAVILTLVLLRKIYKRFFSPQARLNAAYKAMYKRWYALSWHVATLECGRYSDPTADWLVARGRKILQRCKQEYERYKTLPEEPEKWKVSFYPDNIEKLERRLQAVSEKIAAEHTTAADTDQSSERSGSGEKPIAE